MATPNKKAIGSISWKYEKTWHTGRITEINQECDPDIFIRYQTDRMFGFMEPLLKVNKEIKRCYFLTDRSSNGEITFPEFESKGYVCKIDIW